MTRWRPAHTLLVRVGPLTALPDGSDLRSVTGRVTDRVAVLADELGLPLPPHLEVVFDELAGIEVCSDDEAVSARDVDIEEAWRLVAPPEADPLPFGWDWQRWAAGVRELADGPEMVGELVAEVVAGLLQRRPERLLTVRQAVAYLMRHGGTDARRLDPESLLASAAPVFAQGVGIVDAQRVLDHLAGDDAADPERVEALIADLRHDTVDVTVPPDLAPDPFGGAMRRGLGMLAAHLLADLGVRVPVIRLTADGQRDRRCLTVRMNSLTGRPQPCLPAGTVMVDAAPDDLAGRFGSARPVRNPATGGRCSIVDERHAAAVQAAGMVAWTPPEHAVLAVGGELRRRAASLVDVRTVEYELALLFQDFPSLVLEALATLSLAELTRVARSLVRDGPGIRDLRLVLDRLVAFDVLRDAGDGALIDGPAARPPGGADRALSPAEERTAFVRAGMGESLAHRYADSSGRVPAIEAGPDVADRLREIGASDGAPTSGRGLSRHELAHLRETVCRLQRDAGDPWPPVVLTVGAVRARLASQLAEAVPDAVVLASEELPWGTEVRSRGRLTLAGVERTGGPPGAQQPED